MLVLASMPTNFVFFSAKFLKIQSAMPPIYLSIRSLGCALSSTLQIQEWATLSKHLVQASRAKQCCTFTTTVHLSLRTVRFFHPLVLLVLAYVTRQTAEPPLRNQPTMQSCSFCGGALLQGGESPLLPVASQYQDTHLMMAVNALKQTTTSLSLL
jgi:hypothetical protein